MVEIILDTNSDFLTELTKKYNIAIGGCGCCGSPYLYNTKNNDDLGEKLYYDKNLEKYEIN